ncbi:hypothetical protein D9M70_474910 [compost metagenome]
MNFAHAVHKKASAGTSRMNAIAMPTRARLRAVHASAKKIRRFTDASSRKSTLSAKRDTEPMASATTNSTAK